PTNCWRWGRRQRALLCCVLVAAWEAAWGQLRYSVPEELPKGSFVGDVAKDLALQLAALRDRGARVVSADRTQYFALHANSGHLVTAERLDREQLCEGLQRCMLRCEVIVEGEMKVYGIEVEITDINDNAPRFRNGEIELTMSETTVPGSEFPLVDARDPDVGVNSLQSYELSGDEHFSLSVQVGADGEKRPELVLAKALDREEAAFHELVLRASDGGEPSRTGTARIRVSVLDANDNAPVFSQVVYAVRVPEDVPVGSTLLTLTATDADEGLNGDVKYLFKKITDKALKIFHLDPETGSIRLVRSLDFEGGDSYEMEFYGIEVEVMDINDNAPSFGEGENELRMSEMTAPGSRFPLPKARDPDVGVYSLHSYELSGDEHFSLSVQAGADGEKRPELVLAKALDREEAAFHELVLRAIDGGEPSRTGTARIRVSVLDANDNAPVFSQAVYAVRVPEDVPVGSTLLTLTASDADEGLNGKVKYSFKGISTKVSKIFHLDLETGSIRLLRSLDFEEGGSYEMEVQAHDGGGLFDTATVSISVTDVNDNVPEISVRSALSEISEDAPPGTVVALLHVQDRDSGANGEVLCSIEESVPYRLERALDNYYSVVTSRELDREEVSEYNVTVWASDGGSPSLRSSAVLALRVLDVNDNAPVFAEARYSARVPENNAEGALVLTVRAWDADWGQNARVRYRLAEGRVRGAPLSSYVSVQAETGALYALRSFDYEEVREVGLWVRAEDGGAPALSSNVSVRLLIVDENDNAPQVLYPPAAAAGAGWTGVELAPRSAEPGALVAKVVAVDADAGQNAWLSYELAKATEPGLFRVGLHSGEVRTARSPLARDAPRHSLVVVVKDQGRPALSATATLTVVLAESVAELLSELGSALPELSDKAVESELTSDLNLVLVVALALVSLLFVFTVMLVVFFKCRRARSPPIFLTSDKELYSSLGPKAPYNYCSSTLPLPYSYEVCLASESGQKDFTFLRPGAAALPDHILAGDLGPGGPSGKDPSSPESMAEVSCCPGSFSVCSCGLSPSPVALFCLGCEIQRAGVVA
uniref:Cadherin domain-containing protein n=1 Tax=Cairina moschata TaxID=8855 RepID=A0A8C3BX22_CAIMO